MVYKEYIFTGGSTRPAGILIGMLTARHQRRMSSLDQRPRSRLELIDTTNVPETDPGITLVCTRFAAQITPIMPMDGMAIVLLEPDGSTSRVVYSWTNPATLGRFSARRAGAVSTPPQRPQPSLRISLKGREGLLGEVLIRGCGPGVFRGI